MARNSVLFGLNTLLITLVSNNEIPEGSDVRQLQITSPGEIMASVWKKLVELAHIVPSFFAYLGHMLDELAHKIDEIWQWILTVPSFFAYLGHELAHKFDEIWQWILTVLPFVLGGLILLLFLYYCFPCFMICCMCVVVGVACILRICFLCFASCYRFVVGEGGLILLVLLDRCCTHVVGGVTWILGNCYRCLVGCCCWVVQGLVFICRQCFQCFASCCRGVVGGAAFIWGQCCCIYMCCCGGARRGELAAKLMIAPGLGAAVMASSTFEAPPRLYFLNLRAGWVDNLKAPSTLPTSAS